MSTAPPTGWPAKMIPGQYHAHLHLTPQLVLVLIVLGAVLGAAYLVSLHVRPFVTCPRCDGTGKVPGLFFTWARGFCPKCDGHGLVPRLGAHLTGGTPPRRSR